MIFEKNVWNVSLLKVRMANKSFMTLKRESKVLLNFLNEEELKAKVFAMPNELVKHEDIFIVEDVMLQCGLSILFEGEKLVCINDKKCISYSKNQTKETTVRKVKVSNNFKDIKNKDKSF